MAQQDIAPQQKQSETQYYDDISSKYKLNADEEVIIQDLVAEIRDQFCTDIQNSIAILRGAFATRPLFVMFEASLECNPLTDHLIPKNVYPLFQPFIQTFERAIHSIFDQKIQTQIISKLLEVFSSEMEQKQQLENYNFQLYEQLYKLQKQTDADETSLQDIEKKFQQEKIKFLKDQLSLREQSFQAVRYQQKNYNPDQPDYEAELLKQSDLYSSEKSSKEKDLIIRKLQQEKRFLKYEYQSIKCDFDLLKQENSKIPELKRLLDLKISEINKQKEQFREERMKLIDRLQAAENQKDEVLQLVDQKEQGYMSLKQQNEDLKSEIEQLQTENRTSELKVQCDYLNKFSIQQTRDIDILQMQLHEYQKKDESNEIKYKNTIEIYQTERNSQLEAFCQLKNENSQLLLTIEQIQKQLDDQKKRFGGSIVKSSIKVQQLNQSVVQRTKFQQYNISLDQVDNQLFDNQSNIQLDNQQATFLTQDSANAVVKNNRINTKNICIQTEPTVEKIVMNISQIDNNELELFYQQELESFIHSNQYRQMIAMEDRKMEQEKLYYNQLLKEKGLTRVSEQVIKLNVPTLTSAFKAMKAIAGQKQENHSIDQLDVDQVCSDDDQVETLQQKQKKITVKTKQKKLQKQPVIKKPNIINASVVQTSARWENQSVMQRDIRQVNKTFDTQENLFPKHDAYFAPTEEIDEACQVDGQKTPDQKQGGIFSNDLLVDSLKADELKNKDSLYNQFKHQNNSQDENVVRQNEHETFILNQCQNNRDLQQYLIKDQLITKPGFNHISTDQTSIINVSQSEKGAFTKQQPSKVNKAESSMDQQVDKQSSISQSYQSQHQQNQITTINEKQLYKKQVVERNQNQDIDYVSSCQEQKSSQESQKLCSENVSTAVQDVTQSNYSPSQLNVANSTKYIVDSSKQNFSQQSNNDIDYDLQQVTQNLKQQVNENDKDNQAQHQSDQQILSQSQQSNHVIDTCSDRVQSEPITRNTVQLTNQLQTTHGNLDKLFEDDPKILEQEFNIFKDKCQLQELLISSLQRQQAQQSRVQQLNDYNQQQQEIPHDSVDPQLFDSIAQDQTQPQACSQNMLVDNYKPNQQFNSLDGSSNIYVENEKLDEQNIQISPANQLFFQHSDSSLFLQQPYNSIQILQQAEQGDPSLAVVINANQHLVQCKQQEQVSGSQIDVESKSYSSPGVDSITSTKQIQAKDLNQHLLKENQALQLNYYLGRSLIDQQFVTYIHSKVQDLSISQECIDVLFSQDMYPISLPKINKAVFQVLESVLYSESNVNKMVDEFQFYDDITKNILMHIYNSQFQSNLVTNQFNNADLLYLQHFLANEQLQKTFAKDFQKCSLYSKTNQVEPPLNAILPTQSFNYFMFAEQLLKCFTQTSIVCLHESFLSDIQSDDKSTQQSGHQLVDLLLDQGVMKKLLKCKFSQEANLKLYQVYQSNLLNQKLNQQQLQGVINVFQDNEILTQIFDQQDQDDKLQQQYQVVQTNLNRMQEVTQRGTAVSNLFGLESAKQFLKGNIKFRQAVIHLFYSKQQSQKFMKLLQKQDQGDKSQSSSKIQVLLRNFIYNPHFSKKIQDKYSQLSVEEVKFFGGAIFQDEVFQLLDGQKYIDHNEFSAGQRLLSQCLQQKQYDDGISDLQVLGQSNYLPGKYQLFTQQIAGEQTKISEVLPMTIKSIAAERHQMSQVVSSMPPQYNGRPSLDGLDYDADLVISGNSLQLRASPAVYLPRPNAQLFDSLEQIENTDNYLWRTVPPPLPAVPCNAAVGELVHHHYDPKSRAKALTKAQPCDLRVVGRPAQIGNNLLSHSEKRAHSNRPAKREIQGQNIGVQLDINAQKPETPSQK